MRELKFLGDAKACVGFSAQNSCENAPDSLHQKPIIANCLWP